MSWIKRFHFKFCIACSQCCRELLGGFTRCCQLVGSRTFSHILSLSGRRSDRMKEKHVSLRHSWGQKCNDTKVCVTLQKYNETTPVWLASIYPVCASRDPDETRLTSSHVCLSFSRVPFGSNHAQLVSFGPSHVHTAVNVCFFVFQLLRAHLTL